MSGLPNTQLQANEIARLQGLPMLKTHAFNTNGWAMEEMPSRSRYEMVYDIGRISPKEGGARILDARTGFGKRKVEFVTAKTISENSAFRLRHEEYIVVGYAPRMSNEDHCLRVKGFEDRCPVGTSLGDPRDVLIWHPDRPPIIIVADAAASVADVWLRGLLWEVHKEEDGGLTLQLRQVDMSRHDIFFRSEFRNKNLDEWGRWDTWNKKICEAAAKYSGKLGKRKVKNTLEAMHFRMKWPKPWVRESKAAHEVPNETLGKVFVSKRTGVAVALNLAGEAPLLSDLEDEDELNDASEDDDEDENESSEISDASEPNDGHASEEK